ncbi:hypothetical protein D9M72_654670 [compost metagenome]
MVLLWRVVNHREASRFAKQTIERLVELLQRPDLHILLFIDVCNYVFTTFVVSPHGTECFGVMPLCSTDIVKVLVVKVRTDI